MESSQKKILIADDEIEIVELLKVFLQGNHFSVAYAYNGEEALAKFDSFKPDLMILDLKMPKLSGFDVCREIHETRHCKIIIITGYPNELTHVTKFLELGVSDCLVKPFDLTTLLSKINRYLSENPQ